MVFALRMEAQEPEGDSRLRTLFGSLRDSRVAAGMWLTTLPGVLFGTVAVLGPAATRRARRRRGGDRRRVPRAPPRWRPSSRR